jgi:hypothetical protein
MESIYNKMSLNITTSKLVRYFVYIVQDTRANDLVVYQIGDYTIQLSYKPIYVGRGCNNRHLSHADESHNPRVCQFVKENPNHYLIEKVIVDLSWKSSVILEQGLIYNIGRLDLETGPLFNDTAGVNWTECRTKYEIGPLNLELNKLNLILSRLNKVRPLHKVAKSLGISERTLYRMLKDYRVERKRISQGEYEYFQT